MNGTEPAVDSDGETTNWHALPVAEVLRRVDSSLDGLSAEEAATRLSRHGLNRLPPQAGRSALQRLAAQFHDVLIYVLLAAALVTAVLQHWTDTLVIVGVVVINAVIGFLQEGKAEKALDAIRDMLAPRAIVIRDGRRLTVAAENLVPGDVVQLQSGDRVPADVRLLRVKNLQTQEAALTGESLPLEKAVEPVDPSSPLGDRRSLGFAGTLVTVGQGVGVVVTTGQGTEIGRISTMLAEVRPLETPLVRQMARFSKGLTAVILLVAAATFAFGILFRDYAMSEMFLAAVGLSVAAIPEGLPAIMTITLAIGVQRMAMRNAIVRRLPAVETLGAVTVTCSDKTGTLTRSEMTVQSIATSRNLYAVTGAGYAPVGDFRLDGEAVSLDKRPLLRDMARGAMLCGDATVRQKGDEWIVDGDPTEGALVVAAMKAGLDPAFEGRAFPRTDVIPFESEHRFMATLHHDHEGNGYIYAKGAPERIFEMCPLQHNHGRDEAIDRTYWETRTAEISARGERILALARRDTGGDHHQLLFSDVESGLTLLGLIGLADPPRPEAVAAVAQCRSAGIRVKMITGDHAGTARAIAARVGLTRTDTVLTGHDLDALPADELAARVADIDVFARTSPEHKLRLVTALQADGEVVAMTGDGVNDAPALKRADVGVAMGLKGTEAAKEAAEMVLADDNFASIAHAVEEGRTVYDNLQKAILYILPTSGGEALTIIAAIALGQVLPITPVQILWVNMITTVTLALALAFEPAESGVMARPPRDPGAAILSGFLVWRVVFVSLVLVTGTFGLFLWEQAAGAGLETARTVAVNTLVASEIFYLFNARYLRQPVLNRDGLLGSRPALIAIAIVVVFQLGFVYAQPMQELFGTRDLDPWAWMRVIAVASSVLFLVETEKHLMRRHHRRRR